MCTHKNSFTSHKKGFTALISVLVIMFVLLSSLVAIARIGMAERFLLLAIEHKAISEAHAEGCLQVARGLLTHTTQKAIHDIVVPFADTACTIRYILPNTPESGYATIATLAQVGDATTNLRIVVRTSDFAIVKHEEMPHL